jgi:hypothetical protein
MSMMNRRTSILAFATILAAIASPAVASNARTMPGRPPVAICNHMPCPGWDDPDPTLPLSDLRSKTAGLTAAVSDGKMDKAAESLNGLFTGAGMKAKGSDSVAVSAGDWTAKPRTDAGLWTLKPALPRETTQRPRITLVKNQPFVYPRENKHNRTNDPDVERGWREHQNEHIPTPPSNFYTGIRG